MIFWFIGSLIIVSLGFGLMLFNWVDRPTDTTERP